MVIFNVRQYGEQWSPALPQRSYLCTHLLAVNLLIAKRWAIPASIYATCRLVSKGTNRLFIYRYRFCENIWTGILYHNESWWQYPSEKLRRTQRLYL